MDKILYVLGAGFSAPLGLPVMSNFISCSKDMYFSDKQTYAGFDEVFRAISRLSIVKNYYKADLHNIEEILSILEMMEYVSGGKLNTAFKNYISGVVDHFTPAMPNHRAGFSANWDQSPFGVNDERSLLCYFVSNIQAIQLRRQMVDRSFEFTSSKDAEVEEKYSVISLNYDQLLENSAGFIDKRFVPETETVWHKSSYDSEWSKCHLFKLHGCTKEKNIVPPTWAKGAYTEIAATWERAFATLKDANHIRFIGYSLPETDSYFKYFLKAAMTEAQHLKSIDVLCLDWNGDVERRFDSFVDFPGYRFRNTNVLEYFEAIKESTPSTGVSRDSQPLSMSSLEMAHEAIFA